MRSCESPAASPSLRRLCPAAAACAIARGRSPVRARRRARMHARAPGAHPCRAHPLGADWSSCSTSRATVAVLAAALLERAQHHHAECEATERAARARRAAGPDRCARLDAQPASCARTPPGGPRSCAGSVSRRVGVATRERDGVDQEQVAPSATARRRDLREHLGELRSRHVRGVGGDVHEFLGRAQPHRLEQQLELAVGSARRPRRSSRRRVARCRERGRLVSLARELRDRRVEQRLARARVRSCRSRLGRHGRSLPGRMVVAHSSRGGGAR